VIDGLLASARAGCSGVLVIRGEPGIGKTALLDYAACRAGVEGVRVLRGAGVESETELPFAGLHLLFGSALERCSALPPPQRDALDAAFGLRHAGPDDGLLVGLAVLSLLAGLAGDGRLVCLVDDAHWLDRPSAQALVFAARRLHREGIAVVVAAGDHHRPFPAPGLPELRLGGLDAAAAAALLGEHGAGLPAQVRDRVLAQARGNPLGLIELPAAYRDGLVPAAGPGPAAGLGLTDRLRQAFGGQVRRLPEPTQTLLLVAAAQGSGELAVVLAAAATLGVAAADLGPAERAGLVVVADGTVRFRHPLVAAAVYQGAVLSRRQGVHRALADAWRGLADADRRAWHLAAAAPGPDEQAAAALEGAAAKAIAAGGYAAAAAAAQRAVQLTADPAAHAAGSRWPPRPLRRPASWTGHAAWPNAQRPTPPTRSCRPGWPACVPWPTSPRAASTPPTGCGLPPLAELVAQARRARAGAREDLAGIAMVCLATGRNADACDLLADLVADAHAHGRTGWLPALLACLAQALVAAGRHPDALASATHALQVARDSGHTPWASQATGVMAYLAAVDGDQQRCRRLADVALATPAGHFPLAATPWVPWALGLLELGRGRADAALAQLETIARGPARDHPSALRAIPDLVEAAVRVGQPQRAGAPLARFATWAHHADTPATYALVQRCHALVAPSGHAERHYLAALRLHQECFEQARTQLLYGAWLRRRRRKADARTQLRAAVDALDRIDAAPWATRARAELGATGATIARPGQAGVPRLTPQELQVARLAAKGLSNRDIAARLVLSPRTVAYHLYKAYPKLGVTSRNHLDPDTLTQGREAIDVTHLDPSTLDGEHPVDQLK